MNWLTPFRGSTAISWNRSISASAAANIYLSTPAFDLAFRSKSKRKTICYGSAKSFSPTSSRSNDLSFKVPDLRSNRINIDTGAFATGCLTCIVIEGSGIAQLPI
jgi:hypothetical protein